MTFWNRKLTTLRLLKALCDCVINFHATTGGVFEFENKTNRRDTPLLRTDARLNNVNYITMKIIVPFHFF